MNDEEKDIISQYDPEWGDDEDIILDTKVVQENEEIDEDWQDFDWGGIDWEEGDVFQITETSKEIEKPKYTIDG